MKNGSNYKSLMYGLSVCLMWAFVPSAHAKNSLNCTVVDEAGNRVAKKEFTLTSASGKETKKKTDDQGEVKFTGLDDGMYTLGGEGSVPDKFEVSGNTEKPCKYTAISAATANAKLQEVMQLIQQRKTGDAEEKAKKLVELMPGEAASHYVLSVAYATEGKDEAEAEIKKAAELAPDKFKDKVALVQMQALNNQGEMLRQKGDVPGAIKKYQAMLAISPNDPTAYYNLAIAYASLKNYAEALKNIDLVLLQKPDDQDAKQRKALWEKQFQDQLNNPLGK